MPLVSVIVTTYNRKDLLSETLNSILNQTFQDFELIIVDNFSNYNFYEHIESFNNPKIRSFQNINNGVIAINRNYGLKQAKGKFIAFCDDDDIWLLDKLEKQIGILDSIKNNFNVLIYSEIILFGKDVKEEISKRKAVKNINDLIKRNQIPFSSTLMTNSDLLEFDEDSILVASEDYALWLKLLGNNYKPIYIDKPLVRYRVSTNSAFATSTNLFRLKNVYTLIKHVLKNGTSGIRLSRYIYSICLELIRFFYKR